MNQGDGIGDAFDLHLLTLASSESIT